MEYNSSFFQIVEGVITGRVIPHVAVGLFPMSGMTHLQYVKSQGKITGDFTYHE
jgi:hypothetical protein